MVLEITWPLKFVRVQKIAPAAVPQCLFAGAHPYLNRVGQPAPSIRVGYSCIGWLLRPPSIGEPVRVLRIARNGVVSPGCFISTEVIDVPAENEFHTVNSIYRWEEIRTG
jgi:hypothetical protein